MHILSPPIVTALSAALVVLLAAGWSLARPVRPTRADDQAIVAIVAALLAAISHPTITRPARLLAVLDPTAGVSL